MKKKRKKKKKDDGFWEEGSTGYFWLDCLIWGGLVVGMIKFGYPILRSYFGIE